MDSDIKQKPQMLRAQDIIPSTGSNSEQVNSTSGSIPRFDLATEIMAQQRKLTSSRRKRPESRGQPVKEDVRIGPPAAREKISALPTSVYASLIADIVRRDIQKMLLPCNGLQD